MIPTMLTLMIISIRVSTRMASAGQRRGRDNPLSRMAILTLPDLRTIAHGTLTCEVFPNQILYLFSWTEKRASADHPLRGNVPSRASRAQEADSGTVRKAQRGKGWMVEEEARLTRLVEKDGLPWSKVKKRFSRRTAAEIKLQYDNIKNVV
jgi:Myb-like DNA-binding domain